MGEWAAALCWGAGVWVGTMIVLALAFASLGKRDG